MNRAAQIVVVHPNLRPSGLKRNAMPAPLGRLHVLTDFFLQQRFSHAELARRALDGGADTIQFRQKAGGLRHKLYEARRVAAVCRAAGASLIIDDHIDIALALGAGVHLGQTDFPVEEARRLLGPGELIGATATTPAQVHRACRAGADYVGFGPVFSTGSKDNPSAVKGLHGLAAACAAASVPVIAIAGMTPERVRPALDAGAHGVAVLSAVALASDPAAAAARFRAAIDAALASEA